MTVQCTMLVLYIFMYVQLYLLKQRNRISKTIKYMYMYVYTLLTEKYWYMSMVWLQVSQRDILNSIDREMSGDLKRGFRAVG